MGMFDENISLLRGDRFASSVRKRRHSGAGPRNKLVAQDVSYVAPKLTLPSYCVTSTVITTQTQGLDCRDSGEMGLHTRLR